MFEYLFENMRRATEFNLQVQQEMFKKWFNVGPNLMTPAYGAVEEVAKAKREWTELTADLIKKQCATLESQFSTGLKIAEEACHLAEAKNAEELRVKSIELWKKAFGCQRQFCEKQIHDFQTAVVKGAELMLKGMSPPKGMAVPSEAPAPTA